MPSALCLRGYHPLWQNFPGSFGFRSETAAGPYNTTSPRGYPTRIQFALFPFRSPLLRESHLISFPAPSKMFPGIKECDPAKRQSAALFSRSDDI